MDCCAFLEDILLCFFFVASSPAYLAFVHLFVVSFVLSILVLVMNMALTCYLGRLSRWPFPGVGLIICYINVL